MSLLFLKQWHADELACSTVNVSFSSRNFQNFLRAITHAENYQWFCQFTFKSSFSVESDAFRLNQVKYMSLWPVGNLMLKTRLDKILDTSLLHAPTAGDRGSLHIRRGDREGHWVQGTRRRSGAFLLRTLRDLHLRPLHLQRAQGALKYPPFSGT